MPYTQTAFSKAIFEMFENLDSWLTHKYSELPERAVAVYLFGGCAMHLHTQARTSNDVDAELLSIPQLQLSTLKQAIQSVDFDDENGFPRSLDWDGGFDLSFAPVDPAYDERATLIHITKSRLIFIYLVSAVDLAVSKLGRFESVDRQDIQRLYQQGLFDEQDFLDIASEAKKYYCVAIDKLQFNIDLTVEFLRESAQ
ncbi:DUF6036 family nucleotidyltransferase [Pleurocapsa sp. PCC 7319]|uniref:DUF6036 family nucleotidyltransferase n=1 Tax=Pleurocapsa sp. PCC 7319 TaxID=118161 RepID=UPI00034984EB|nr:DUF6036 family nucleotidyltransferase [Pleurocapsa sp. PCC 7319]